MRSLPLFSNCYCVVLSDTLKKEIYTIRTYQDLWITQSLKSFHILNIALAFGISLPFYMVVGSHFFFAIYVKNGALPVIRFTKERM